MFVFLSQLTQIHTHLFVYGRYVCEKRILCMTGARSAQPETKGLAEIRKSAKEKRLEPRP